MDNDKSSPRSKKSHKKKDKDISAKITSKVDDINKEIIKLQEKDNFLL
jgi:hypothetical protein